MAETLDVRKLLDRFPNRFDARPFYLADSDSLQFYHENVDHYAERIDCWLTVYKEFETDKLIGFKLKNVKVLLSRFDVLGLGYLVSKSRAKWTVMLQPVLAYIPVALEPKQGHVHQYHDVLTSFGDRLNTPVEVAHG